jgi:Acyl-CoA dehydrogenase, C-terminal domain
VLTITRDIDPMKPNELQAARDAPPAQDGNGARTFLQRMRKGRMRKGHSNCEKRDGPEPFGAAGARASREESPGDAQARPCAAATLFVPKAFTCPVVPPFERNKHYRGPLYRLPMLAPIVLAAISPVAIAFARSAIDEVKALSAKRVPLASAVPLRERGVQQARLGRAEAMLRSARALCTTPWPRLGKRRRREPGVAWSGHPAKA